MRTAVIVRIGADGKSAAQYYPEAGAAMNLFRGSQPEIGGEIQLWRTGRAKPRIRVGKAIATVAFAAPAPMPPAPQPQTKFTKKG